MPKAIKKKVKKKSGGPEFQVQGRLADVKSLLEKKQRTFAMYGAAAVVVLFVFVGTLLYRSSAEDKAGRLDYEAYKMYHGDYQKMPMPRQEQLEKALDLFKQAYGQKKSPRRLLYIASCNKELGRHDEALKTLEDFVRTYPSESDLLPIAYEEMAGAQLKKGNKEAALKALDTIYRSPGSIYKDRALVETARILESEGKREEAMAKYKELIEKFKESPFVDEANSKLGEKKEG